MIYSLVQAVPAPYSSSPVESAVLEYYSEPARVTFSDLLHSGLRISQKFSWKHVQYLE